MQQALDSSQKNLIIQISWILYASAASANCIDLDLNDLLWRGRPDWFHNAAWNPRPCQGLPRPRNDSQRWEFLPPALHGAFVHPPSADCGGCRRQRQESPPTAGLAVDWNGLKFSDVINQHEPTKRILRGCKPKSSSFTLLAEPCFVPAVAPEDFDSQKNEMLQCNSRGVALAQTLEVLLKMSTFPQRSYCLYILARPPHYPLPSGLWGSTPTCNLTILLSFLALVPWSSQAQPVSPWVRLASPLACPLACPWAHLWARRWARRWVRRWAHQWARRWG